MKITDVQNVIKASSIKLPVGGADTVDIAFKWRPNAWTPQMEIDAKKAFDEANDGESQQSASFGKLLAPSLAWIDLQDDEGADILDGTEFGRLGFDGTIPIIRKIPNNVMVLVIQKIGEENDPGKKKSGRSDGSFSG